MIEEICKNWIGFGSLIVAAIGVPLVIIQLHSSKKTQRGKLVGNLLQRFQSDKALSSAFSIIEYKNGWYDSSFHDNSEGNEVKMDQFLLFCNYICYLMKEKMITKKDFELFQYWLKRTCESSDVQNYLWNIYHYSLKQESPCSFSDLIEYAIKEEMICGGCFRSSTPHKEFIRYLNF